MAIRENRLDLIRQLLAAGASAENGAMSESAFELAAQQNNLEIAKLLLEAGANPNAEMEDYHRVIITAADQGNLEMVQLLVAHGADVNAWSQGETAIMSAARQGHR